MLTQPTTEATLDTRIPHRWLTLVRVIWLVVVISLVTMFAAGVPLRFNELRETCVAEECGVDVLALSPQEEDALRGLGLSMDFYAAYQVGLEIYFVVIFIPLAGLIFWRKSDSWIGIVVSLALVFLAIIFFSSSPPALARAYPNLKLTYDLLVPVSIVLFVLLFYLLPDGRFVPRWTRLVALVFAVSTVIEPLLPARSPLTASGSVVLVLILLLGLIVGLSSQIYRYRRVSTLVQRQQTKWIMFGLTAMFSMTLVWIFFAELFPLQPGPARLVFNFSLGIQFTVITLFPLSLVLSILRYRLWDIDIVINRALVYGLLTGTLVFVYFSSVTLMQSLFATVSGQQSTIAIVISTLAIAALFTPLRTRVQNFIDRRFYRSKYDAAKTLAAFAATVRDEPELERLSESLLTVVQETMQPAHVSLWLKKTADSRPQRAGTLTNINYQEGN